jgi:hypothetical protein
MRVDLRKCENPDCQRLVPVGTYYCCTGCDAAHEGCYEIHPNGPFGHSEGCNQRHAERQEKRKQAIRP